MKNFILHQTLNTPYIEFNSSSHKLEVIGVSTCLDPKSFYKPIIDWLQQYSSLVYYLKNFKKNPLKIDFYFELEKINFSSVKWLYELLLIVREISDYNNVEIQLTWAHDSEDIDIYESGETLQEMTGLDFNFLYLRVKVKKKPVLMLS